MKGTNILYELHESDFVDFAIKDNDLIFRVAINCGVEERLGVISDFAEKFYLYDIVCHNFEMIEENYNEEQDLLLCDILCFKKIKGNYLFSINYDVANSVDFVFNCDNVEWVPLKIMTSKELDNIAKTEYFKIK